MKNKSIGAHVGALIRDVVEAIALAVVLFFVLQLGLQSTVVEGTSMQPNFVDGEWVLVNKLAYRMGEPRRGDVVVFHDPGASGKDFIKRVIALPGETVSIRDGSLFIDGEAVDEPWMPVDDPQAFGPYRVPQDQLFVLGDNRPYSNDSRSWSTAGLPQDRVVGKVWVSVWPPETFGVVQADGTGRGGGPEEGRGNGSTR